MYGTLAGALSGRKIPFDRNTYTATVDGRIVGIGKTIRIESIVLHYDFTIPPESLEVAERALRVHPEACRQMFPRPHDYAHQSWTSVAPGSKN